MTPEAAQEWIDALESGEYVQGKKRLQNKDGSMCCLGVLADIRGELNVRGRWEWGFDESGIGIPSFAHQIVGVNAEAESVLVRINDNSDSYAPVIAKIKELYIDGASQ